MKVVFWKLRAETTFVFKKYRWVTGQIQSFQKAKKLAVFGACMRPIEKKDKSETGFLIGVITLNSGSDGSHLLGISFNGHGLTINSNVSNCQVL